MDRRTFVEFIVAWILVIGGCVIAVLPLFNVNNVKNVFTITISLYGVIHLIKNFYILKSQEYSGFSTAINCAIVLFIMMFFDVYDSPWNLALVLFIWIILMSLTRLKESDYYHDRKNKVWLLNIVNLILFILSGILTSINLYYTGDIQILVLGFFFLINGILELMDPLVVYIIEKNKSRN